MTTMDVVVGSVALACVFTGVLVARLAQARDRAAEDPGHRSPGRFVGLLLMAIGLFFAINVSLWLILPALVVAEAARRLSHRAGA